MELHQKHGFRAIWEDSRSFLKRLCLAGLVALGFMLTFTVFGVFDIFVQNRDIFPFLLSEFWGFNLLVSAAAVVLFSVALALLRGKLFDIALSLFFGVTLAGCAQFYFLNLNLGLLTGDAIDWQAYALHGVFNLLLWGVIIALPFVLYLFSRKLWRVSILLLSAFIIGQGFSIPTSLVQDASLLNPRKVNRYLSGQKMFEVSAKDNIFVFIVDRLDGNYVDEMLKIDPSFFDPLDGFTRYPNYTSLYTRTFPSVPQLLTGQTYLFDVNAKDFFDRAFRESTFLPDLRKANYTTKIYSENYFAFMDIQELDGLADNVVDGRVTVDQTQILKKMLKLSLYRYVPHVLKPRMWMSTADFTSNTTLIRQDPWMYVPDDFQTDSLLRKEGLTVQHNQNNFALIHLNGSHEPINMDENIRHVEVSKITTEAIARQTMGCFKIIFEYLRQLKALGLYESATIAICGDHGYSYNDRNLKAASTTNLFLKPKGSAKTHLLMNNAPGTHAYFQATVLKAAGLPSDSYGTTLFDLTGDSQNVRKYYNEVNVKDGTRYLEEYEIVGDARNFENWRKIRELPFLFYH